MNIEAGAVSQIEWGDGNWVFLDIGFSRAKPSCGLLIANDEPRCVQFGEASRIIVSLAEASRLSLNLVIEAPLSVCFNKAGNPTGRSIEKEGSKTRYWYLGLGCAVLVAAMYIIRDLHGAQFPGTIRLFEGFVSYKERSVRSSHEQDVELLRDVVYNPDKFKGCIFSAEQLKQDPSDKLFSSFCVGDMDCGVPIVIKR